MGMGADTLFSGRFAQCAGHSSGCCDVYATGYDGFGDWPLYGMAWPAMGHQTLLEPVRRSVSHEALVGPGHADSAGIVLGWCGFHAQHPGVVSGHDVFLFLMAFSSATHDIAADGYYMLALDDHHQAWFVGIRNTFYRLAVIMGNGVLVPVAGLLAKSLGCSAAFSWSLVFYGLAALFIAFCLYHSFLMPRAADDKKRTTSAHEVVKGIKKMFVTFFTKMPVRLTVFAMLFFLLYRLPEAMLNTMTKTFLLRSPDEGGLGMSLVDYGIASGTVGMIGLTLGGILGGILAGRDGLKRWLWPMVCAISLPDIVYVWLSYDMTSNLYVISTCLFIEQFGYGLGFTALTSICCTTVRESSRLRIIPFARACHTSD